MTAFGYIDILTVDEIIEVKEGRLWKHALGQILAYSDAYPEHKKIIWLFDIEINPDIEKICTKHNVEVRYYNE